MFLSWDRKPSRWSTLRGWVSSARPRRQVRGEAGLRATHLSSRRKGRGRGLVTKPPPHRSALLPVFLFCLQSRGQSNAILSQLTQFSSLCCLNHQGNGLNALLNLLSFCKFMRFKTTFWVGGTTFLLSQGEVF